ncbi:type II toxin-antitoxin system Phd/YefM family antitoxin [Gordonia hydrophobica]|uniref:Type II toxin-antitoxin system Phd/YefM family antitoxin n=1 Tax=Gordonia hydrophobica TaxID=40516 RepID=A0ABZ2U4C1_9ACTN|nr:type II toxin-antitoxin system Phd/YefM family antitoxin [Gordonia hydrophobica]MBM7366754.1 prevent-host-death family protein [Gordonia hydrophobica]
MRTLSRAEALRHFDALLTEVQSTRQSVMITSGGRPVAVIAPADPHGRQFGTLPGLHVPDDFDAPLTDEALWV